MSTLTYVYADSTAVVGPLATYAEPHCYDLCQMHTDRLTAPRGWEIVRITPDPDALKPSTDDLEALADAVRQAARPRFDPNDEPAAPAPSESDRGVRRGHLRVVPEVTTLPAVEATKTAKSTSPRPTDPHHPVHSSTRPGGQRSTPDEPFDHEGLW